MTVTSGPTHGSHSTSTAAAPATASAQRAARCPESPKCGGAPPDTTVLDPSAALIITLDIGDGFGCLATGSTHSTPSAVNADRTHPVSGESPKGAINRALRPSALATRAALAAGPPTSIR